MLFKEEDQKKEETLHTDEQLASRRGHNQREESKYCSPRAVQQGVTVCEREGVCMCVCMYACECECVLVCMRSADSLPGAGLVLAVAVERAT